MAQVFLGIFSLALFTWAFKYFFMLYYYRRKKEDINKLEARTAVLRMLLKAKLKRKGAQFQDQYKDEKDFLATISSKLELLTTYNFNRNTDFEDVVGILSAISQAIDQRTVEKNPTIYMAQQARIQEERENLIKEGGLSVAKDNAQNNSKSASEIDRWAQLLKYDKGNLYIINEIVETTSDLRKRIEVYNAEQENKTLHIRMPDEITINGYSGLKAVIMRDREKNLATKEENKQRKQKELYNPDFSDSDAASVHSSNSNSDQGAA